MSLFKTRRVNKNIDVILSSSGVRAPCFIGGLDAILEKGYHIHRIVGQRDQAIHGCLELYVIARLENRGRSSWAGKAST